MNSLKENFNEDAVVLEEVKEVSGLQVSNYSNPTDQGSLGQPADGDSAKSGMLNTMKNFFTVQTVLKVMGELSKNGGITPDMLNEITEVCKGSAGSLHTKFKAMFLISELLTAGYKLAFDDENREIIASHVNALYDDVKESKDKRFSEAGKILEAKILLEAGKTLHDANGNQITLDTADIDMYVVVLDSQHRCMVCLLHPEIDLWMEFVELEGTSTEFYVKFNNLRRNHTGNDQKRMIKEMHPGQVSLLDKIEVVKKNYSVTDKFAEALLIGKVDTFKKKILADIQLGKTDIGKKFDLDPEKAKTGIAVMDIVNTIYASNADLHKKFKKYQFPMALWNIFEGKDSEEKKSFMYDFCGFLKYTDEATITAIMEKVDDKDFANFIRPKLSEYVKSLSDEDKEKRNSEIDALLQVADSARSAQPTVFPNSKVKAISSGSFSNVLANMKAIAKLKEEAAKKKAQKADTKKTADAKPAEAEKGKSSVVTPDLKNSTDN